MTEIREFAPGLYRAGQPSPEQLSQLIRDGVRTVPNLRHPEEPEQYDERALVEAHGAEYLALPVIGAQDLTSETVGRFSAVLAHACSRGPVLVHCASANRVGALVALQQGWQEGTDTEAALHLGRAAGLASLEPAVRELLACPPR